MLKRAVHPGLVLKEELAELGITPTEFARQIGVPPNRVSQIINGKRAITGDTALRFGHWFGVEPEFWLNLQNHFDLVRAQGQLGKEILRLPTKADFPSANTSGEDEPPLGERRNESDMGKNEGTRWAMAKLQPVASTHVDAHNSEFTVEALQSVADQINHSFRKPAMDLYHDRTVPPLGAVIAGHLKPTDDGYHVLLAEFDLFPDPTPVGLPTGETGYRQFSQKARYPFESAEFGEGERITVSVDSANFELPDDVNQFFRDVRDKQLIEFDTAMYARRAVENDPELIITITLKLAAIWLGSKFASSAAKSTGEIFADELKNFYSLLRSAIVKYASYARPRNRPTTYVLQIPGTPNLEFVARSSDVHNVMLAFTDGSHVECRDVAMSFSQCFDNVEFIQFMLSDDGRWQFNYLLTRDGHAIGSRQAYSRRAVLLQQGEESGGGWSVDGEETLQE